MRSLSVAHFESHKEIGPECDGKECIGNNLPRPIVITFGFNQMIETFALPCSCYFIYVPSRIVLKKSILNKVARDTRLETLVLIVTLMCHRVTRLGHRD